MKLSILPKIKTASGKRIGRGYGSGKGGHTTGKGQKGQKTRGKIGLMFEGTKMRKSLIRRMPMMRGKGKLKSFQAKPVIINVKYLNLFTDGDEVTLETLIRSGITEKEVLEYGVKILGDGILEKKLTVKLPVSKGAKAKIEKAGGSVLKINTGKPLNKTRIMNKVIKKEDSQKKTIGNSKKIENKKNKTNKKKKTATIKKG